MPDKEQVCHSLLQFCFCSFNVFSEAKNEVFVITNGEISYGLDIILRIYKICNFLGSDISLRKFKTVFMMVHKLSN